MAVNTTKVEHSYHPGTAMAAEALADLSFTAASEIVVELELAIAPGVRVQLDQDADYSLTLPSGGSWGSIRALAEYDANDWLHVRRVTPRTQEEQFTPFNVSGPAIGRMGDKLLRIAQEQDVEIARSLRVTSGGAMPVLPADRAGRFLAFDASGNPVASDGLGADETLRADLAASGGAALIGDFGAVIAPTDAPLVVASKMQAAAAGGSPINLAGTASSMGIVTNGEDLRLAGGALGKSANGVLLTHSGNYGQLTATTLRGTGRTGANLYLTGSETDLINCNSLAAGSEAVSSVGAVHIFGGVYESVNASLTVPDIRIGQAAAATLYSSLIGIRTTQHRHGIYELNTGSTFRGFSQFGDLTIDSDAVYVTGCNGGHTVGCRITGNVTVRQSTSVWSSNLVASDYNVTFAAGTSSHSFGPSNQVGAANAVNNLGSNASHICVNRGDGERGLGGPVYCFGASSGTATIAQGAGAELWVGVSASAGAPDPANGSLGTPGYWVAAYNKGFRSRDSAGTGIYNVAVVYDASGSVTLGHGAGAASTVISSGSGGVLGVVSNVTITRTTSAAFLPDANGTTALGGASNRWSEVFAATGTINTSDADLKEQIADIPAAWLDAWGDVQWRRFKMKDAVLAKGEAARWHTGLIAQEVRDAFTARSLDATAIGLLCFDEWDAEPAQDDVWQEEYTDDAGHVYPRTLLSPAREARAAGSAWGLRYAECQAMEAAWVRRALQALSA